MKSPALCVLPALGAGILLAHLRELSVYACGGAALAFLVVSIVLCAAHCPRIALICALTTWLPLGALAAAVERSKVPANLISPLASSGAVDLSGPLRWRGILHDDPEHLPYGWRFEVSLESFENAAGIHKTSGGLWATYYDASVPLPQPLRAGDEVELLAKASLLHDYGDPGAIDYRAQLAREGIDVTASLRSLALITATGTHHRSLRALFARARGRLLSRIDDMFPSQPRDAAILRAMLLGDRTFIDTETADEFQKTSAFHTLVVAGLHVAALAGFVFWMARLLRLGRFASSLLAMASLVAYWGIVQDRPPILRATLMAAIYLCAAPLYRRVDPLQTVSLAAIAILFWRPSELRNPSFQFSFLAVGVIAGVAVPWLAQNVDPLRRALVHVSDSTRDPRFSPKLAQLRLDLRAVAAKFSGASIGHATERATATVALPMRGGVVLFETFIVSAVIQLGLLPLSISQYHRVAILGSVANIGAVLLTSLIVPLGFLSLAAAAASRHLGTLVAVILHVLLTGLFAIVHAFARITWANIRPPDAPRLLSAGFLGALLALGYSLRHNVKTPRRFVFATVLALAAALVAHPFRPRLYSGSLEATVLDVGQGDSIFVAAPGGRTLLVDGGGTVGAFRIRGMRTRFDIGEEVVSRYLWSRGITTLDAVALTHAHEDHLEGLTAVLENFRVAELWVGHDVNSAAYRNLLAAARRHGTRVIHWKQGDALDFAGAQINVLWPASDDAVREAQNDDSLVLRLSYRNESALLAGDIEHGVEAQLADGSRSLTADFLKVAHHGSKTSSTAAFLDRVRPSFAAISVGENNAFGHPSEITLENLRNARAEVLRTDRDGAITFLANGSSEQISSFRGVASIGRPNSLALRPALKESSAPQH